MVKYQIKPDHSFDINDFKNAFVNFLYAKKSGQDLVFIIDDYDVESLKNGEEKDIVSILKKFGIEFYQTVYSSENLSFHQTFGMQLTTAGKTFSCFCKEPKELYDGKCLKLSDYEVLDNQTVAQIRLKKDKNGKIDDDFVILDFRKYPTDIFSTSINDMIYNINFITYQENQKKDCARRDYIWKLINYDSNVKDCQVPIILNPLAMVNLFEDKILPDSIGFYVYAKLFNKNLDDVITIHEIDFESLDFDNLIDDNFEFSYDELKIINSLMVNRVRDINNS
jgi:glutamyl-tRNA synthetase